MTISTVPPDSQLHTVDCWYCGDVPYHTDFGLPCCAAHFPASAVVREDAKKAINRLRMRQQVWQVIATLACGCELIHLEGRADAHERHTGPCVYHLCRKCGSIPAADSEPDRLCFACMEGE